jgi:hypothetical protein
VEAITSESTPSFLARALGRLTFTPGARAVAGTAAGPYCMLALGPTNPSVELGNSVINMPSCGIGINGDLNAYNPGSDINANGIGVSGSCTGSGCVNMGGMSEGNPAVTDPLAGELSEPSNPGGCVAWTPASGALTAGCYTTITLGNSESATMGGGIYFVTGGITLGQNAGLTGNGVLIYLDGNASFTAQNNPVFNLTAMTSGPYSGILLYGDPSDTHVISFGNNPTGTVSGAWYAPTADLTFGNSFNATSDCVLFVVASINIPNGISNFNFDNSCSGYAGSPLLTVAMAE